LAGAPLDAAGDASSGMKLGASGAKALDEAESESQR
jgi:hypothetical protein